MWDSYGKIPDGLYEGNFQAVGSALSCKEIDVDFKGKYCLVSFEPINMRANKVKPDGMPRVSF